MDILAMILATTLNLNSPCLTDTLSCLDYSDNTTVAVGVEINGLAPRNTMRPPLNPIITKSETTSTTTTYTTNTVTSVQENAVENVVSTTTTTNNAVVTTQPEAVRMLYGEETPLSQEHIDIIEDFNIDANESLDAFINAVYNFQAVVNSIDWGE